MDIHFSLQKEQHLQKILLEMERVIIAFPAVWIVRTY